MPLYECPKCGTVENTALGHFWNAAPKEVACSECHTGTWHGRFEKEPASNGWVLEDKPHNLEGKPPFITK